MNRHHSLTLALWAACLAAAACSSGSRSPHLRTAPSGAAAPSSSTPTTSGPTAPAPSPSTSPAPATGGAITTFETGLTPSAELFVSPSGSDDTGDGSVAAPFATIQRAAQGLTPGTAIRVQPGTYTGGISLRNLAGTPGAPLWIGGVPGQARPVIQGGLSGLQLSAVRYLVLHDLILAGAQANGINCDDASQYADPDVTRHLVFRDLEVRDVGTGGNHDGMKLSGVDDFYVLDCVVERVNAGSGIDMVGCHGGLIARCRFVSSGQNGVQTKGGSRDVEIRWCTFVDAGQRALNIGGSTGDAYYRPPLSSVGVNVEASQIRALGNVIVGSGSAFAFVGAVDSVVAHTTVVDPSMWLYRILQERGTGGGFTFAETQRCRVTNTVFWFARGAIRADVNVGPGTQPATFTLENNLYHAHDAPGSSQPNLPATETGTVLGDPGFQNVGSGDVRVGLTSPARAAGAPQALLSEDADGVAFAPAPTIGAFEAR